MLPRLLNRFDIGQTKTRVVVALFHEEAEVLGNFATRLSYDKDELVKTVKDIRLATKYGTRVDEELEIVYKDIFSKDGGDREKFPNVLAVFTDGKPFPQDTTNQFKENLQPLRVSLLIKGENNKLHETADS